ncbi:hypothetical protein ACVRY7_00840 [Streptococcus ictaluri]|uniref:Uncharacterized protein n=1 Tax=Streptococcus ictaluri 707-05 TaxID=764299 RepID=G5K0F3_9STRE|nr:hypothetical protein [Streptococcus ictaluri]EHI70622.1 hypothetical protein STRIC_0075 [Streptococcus ictaluri 707-05]
MNISLFFKLLTADIFHKPVKIKNKEMVDYALRMNYVQYIVEGYRDNLEPIIKKDRYSLELEGKKALYALQIQFITWLISILALVISVLAYLKK